ASAEGSFFTQTSSVTIQGGLGTQTFTAQAGESLETFFQTVDNSGIGVTMAVDATSGGRVQIVNNNFGINSSIGTDVAGPGATKQIVNGQVFPAGTVFSGGPAAASVLSANGDFATTGLCMQFMTKGVIGTIASSGTFIRGFASNAQITIQGTLGSGQILTSTGINSDQIVGSGSTAGLVITLVNPGQLSYKAGDLFTVKQNGSAGLQFQIGANAGQTVSLALDAINSETMGVSGLDVSTQADAESSITQVDRAIQFVSTARANMGAVINRLTNSVNNDQSAQENAMASQSRIRDVNIAEATIQLTRDEILQQAGTAVLAQANQESSSLLTLLR
ncbi:MAG TPA: flagellin, partial [Chloroflexota bacterium]|nr:flagellin [Chloroflexota bacterium]